ncbi:MAG: hypothetical protein WCW53_05145 [Syntrophales bacterium]
MLTIPCQCGEIFHAEEHHVGRLIKCQSCGQILSIGIQPQAAQRYGFVEAPTRTWRMVFREKFVKLWETAALTLLFVVSVLFLSLILFFYVDKKLSPVTYVPVQQPQAEVASKPIAKPKAPVKRLSNGFNIWMPQEASGRGTLRVNNGTNYDATISLINTETNTTCRFIYIRAHEVATLSKIAPCQARLLFALGTNWDSKAEEFLEDISFSMFENLFEFTEAKTENGVRWATFSVTLHPVPEGKAKTRKLSKEEFQRQQGRRKSG